MAQVGLHALVGLVVGQHCLTGVVSDRNEQRALLTGFILGNMAPDLDFMAVVAVWPVDQTLAFELHRSFSHSFLAALTVVVGLHVTGLLLEDRLIRMFGYGLALGMLGHMVLDLFIWFSPVDLFWPASHYGGIPPVDLWDWWTTPPLIEKLLGAAEFAAFGLYYDHLMRAAKSLGTDEDVMPSLQRMSRICWVMWAVLSLFSFDFPNEPISVLLYVPMGIVFMPACLYLTWRMSETFGMLQILREGQM